MASKEQLPGTFFGPANLVDLLGHRARCQPDDVAFTFLTDGENEQERVTYKELDRQARAIGAWLESLDLVGQRALLLYPAGLELFLNLVAFTGMITAFHAHSAATATAVTIVFNWDMISFIPLVGVEIAVTSLVGRYMGARQPDVAHRSTISECSLWVQLGYSLRLLRTATLAESV